MIGLMSIEEICDGATIAIDKPIGWTSFDVVNRMKWFLMKECGVKNIKIGHAGTLDPLASGLLVVCTGSHTKRIQHIQGGTKHYTGSISLGQTTPSYDLETEPEGSYDTSHIEDRMIEETSMSFIGRQLQRPPDFSAKIINGKRAYESARKGIAVEMRMSEIEIYSLQVQRVEEKLLSFDLKCSKGTYVRSLAHDFGKRLGSGAYLSSLRRLGSEPYDVADAPTIDIWIENMKRSVQQMD
jgi:tRNA pseudouridine55 synthase